MFGLLAQPCYMFIARKPTASARVLYCSKTLADRWLARDTKPSSRRTYKHDCCRFACLLSKIIRTTLTLQVWRW